MGVAERRSRMALGREIDRHTDLISTLAKDVEALRRDVSTDRKESEARDRKLTQEIIDAESRERDARIVATCVLRRGFFGRLKWQVLGR